jgi:hypothetical protein
MSKSKSGIRIVINTPTGIKVAAVIIPKAGVLSAQCTPKALWSSMRLTYPKELESLSMTSWRAKYAGRSIEGDFTDAERVGLMKGDSLSFDTEAIQ